MRDLAYEIAQACLGYHEEYRCIESISGLGVEVGDRCIKVHDMIVPIVRFASEGGTVKPFNAIKEQEGFVFVRLT